MSDTANSSIDRSRQQPLAVLDDVRYEEVRRYASSTTIPSHQNADNGMKIGIASAGRSLIKANEQFSEYGMGIASMNRLIESDSIDRKLKRAGWMSGMTTEQVSDQRKHMMATGRRNGNSASELAGTFENLVSQGLSHQQARFATDAIDQVITLTGESSDVVSDALMASFRSFDLSLKNDDQGMQSLAKMAVTSHGNRLSLVSIPKIIDAIDGTTKRKLGENQTLSLVGEFSRQGFRNEDIAPMTASVGRIYVDPSSQMLATKVTGVPWVNGDGSMRTLDIILEEMQSRYRNLGSDQDRETFIDSAFQDEHARKAFRHLLSKDGLSSFRRKEQQLLTSYETVSAGIAMQRDSASVVAGRVKNSFTEAVDRVAQPINQFIAGAGDFLLDDLNLSGGGMVALGVGGSIAGGAISGRAGKVASAIGLPDGVSTMRNAVLGKALERSMGITPVFVTNWPASNDSGLLASLTSIGGGLVSGLLRVLLRTLVSRVGLALAAIGIVGYGVYSAVSYFSKDEDEASLKLPSSPQRRIDGHISTRAKSTNAAWLMENEFTEAQFQDALLLTPHNSDDPVRDARKILLRRRLPNAVDFSAFSMLPPLDDTISTANPIATEAATIAAAAVRDAMAGMVASPIQIEVHTDVPWLYAELGESTRREARRGE